MQKISKLVAGAPDGGKKETKEIERIHMYMLLFLQFYLIYFTLSIR